MGSEVVPVDVRYATVGPYGLTEGMALPDFSAAPADVRNRLIADAMAAAATPQANAASLNDAVLHRFGPSLGASILRGLETFTSDTASELAPEALDILSYFKRVRLDDDDRMAALKAESVSLDARLAVRAGRHETPRNYYPAAGGMAAFCDRLLDWLRANGVTVVLGARVDGLSRDVDGARVAARDLKVRCGKVYWSLPTATIGMAMNGLPNVSAHFQRLSVRMQAFRVASDAITETTYVHDYTCETPVFRSSAPGKYGRQTDAEGRSFVISEVYDLADRPRLTQECMSPQRIFADLKTMGQVAHDAHFDDYVEWSIPTALVLPRRGWLTALAPLREGIDAEAGWLLANDLAPRGKRSIFAEVERLLQPMGVQATI
jgi:protoporphyrinogen oxidase